jgi:hypothetical protein
VGLRDNQKMAFVYGIDIHKGKDPLIFIDLYRGNLTCRYFTKDAIHG